MSRFMRRYPSPSLIVSITALVVALGGASYSATGGNFILGQANTAATQTVLSANVNGRTLWLGNSSTAAGATGLGINVALTKPPMLVNSSVKVANLNADRLDGLDSTQLPSRLVVPFNLAAGANSAPIALPANQPVFVMGVKTGGNNQGVGQVTLLRVPGQFIEWTGLESPAPSGVTYGFGTVVGTHIVYLDFDHQVDIEVNSVDTIRIHNGSSQQRAGTVTLIW